MTDLLKVDIPKALEPAVWYADAVNRYQRSIGKIIAVLDAEMRYSSPVISEFKKAFADYREALIAEDDAHTILTEEKLFDTAEKYGYPVDVYSNFNSMVLDFSFHVRLVADTEKKCLELIQ